MKNLSAFSNTARIILLLALSLLIALSGCTSKEEKIAKHTESARKYFEADDFRSAVLELKNVIQLDPENDEAHLRLGEAYMALGQIGLAVQSYVAAITSNPDNLSAHLKAGQIFLIAKKTMEARRAAKRILKEKNNDIDALQLLAAVQIQEKNIDAAIKTLQHTVTLAPQNSKPHHFLARSFFAAGNLDDAIKTCQQTIAIDPSFPAPYAMLIRIYGEKKQWDKAKSVLSQMSSISGGYKELVDAARFCEGRRQLSIAKEIYQKAIEIAPGGNALPTVYLGDYYRRRGNFVSAMDMMKQALEIQKDDPMILAKIAALYIDLDDIERAEAAIGKAIEKDENHVLANFIKGKLLFLKKDLPSALDQFDQTIMNDPDNSMAYYYKALCLMGKGMQGRTDADIFRAAAGFHDDTKAWIENQAEENLLKVLALSPNHLGAKIVLAEIYLRNRDLPKARDQIKSALSLAPRRLETLSLQGSLKILEKDFKGAVALTQKVLGLYPRDGLWHYRMGIVYLLMKETEKALTAFEKALDLDPNQIDAFELMIGICLGNKNYDKALELCDKQKIKARENQTAIALIKKMEGNIFLARGNIPEAQRYFQEAIAHGPHLISPRMSLAELYARGDQTDLAIRQYEDILEINPNMLTACMAIGDIHYRKGGKKMAERYYRRALKIDNGYGPAANNLAFLLSYRNDKVREALNFAQLANKKMPNDAHAKDTLGWIHYRMGNYYKAIVELEGSLAIDSENPMANFHLGLAYYQNNEFEKAKIKLKKALSLDPGFEGADEARVLVDDE